MVAQKGFAVKKKHRGRTLRWGVGDGSELSVVRVFRSLILDLGDMSHHSPGTRLRIELCIVRSLHGFTLQNFDSLSSGKLIEIVFSHVVSCWALALYI